MTRVRRTGPFDSLELLLDTLCNTFGGILFIAILVVILLQLSHPKVDMAVPENEPLPDVDLAASLSEQLRNVEASLATQQTVLASLHAEQWQILNDERVALEGELSKRETERDRLKTEVKELEVSTRILEASEEDRKRKIDSLKHTLDDVRNARQHAQREKQEAVIMPVAARTARVPVAIVLRYGKMYVWHNYEAGVRKGLNTDEFIVVESTLAGLRTRPKVSQGILLDGSNNSIQLIKSRLKGLPPGEFYLDVLVRPDSYDQFANFRSIAGKLGYQYAVLPCTEDEIVFDRGGQERMVQ